MTCEVTGLGYHPCNDAIPRTAQGRFEICLGAILTQNTAWRNVEKALQNIMRKDSLDAMSILNCEATALIAMIRPAGYFNQKAKSVQAIAEWFCAVDPLYQVQQQIPDRTQLLSVRGVGPETADSILLYAYSAPTFVVDAYTRRIFSSLEVVESTWSYEQIRSLFMRALPADVPLLQECHALIVEHAKRFFQKKQLRESKNLLGSTQ